MEETIKTKPFVSLCILSFKREAMLLNCLNSLLETIDYPCEVIVNDDTGENQRALNTYFEMKRISKLILTNGNNRGVGASFQNCLSLAEGEYVVKMDTDLTFEPEWLSVGVRILKNAPDLAALSFFNYRHYDPKDERFNTLERHSSYNVVDDFVSSIYIARRKDLIRLQPMGDDGNHLRLRDLTAGKLAVTNKDYCTNVGFGIGRSVYIEGTPEKNWVRKTYNTPHIVRGI